MRPATYRSSWVTAIVVFALVLALDVGQTRGAVPPPPEPCVTEECVERYSAALHERIVRAERLEHDLDRRTRGYALVLVLVVVSVAGAAWLRAPTRRERRTVADDLGITAVTSLLVGTVALIAFRGESLVGVPPVVVVFLPAAVLVGLAVLGRVAVRAAWGIADAASELPDEAGRRRSLVPPAVARAALVIGPLMTILCIVLFVADPGFGRGCGDPRPHSSGLSFAFGQFAGLAAMAAGVVCLAALRWLVALACLVVPPLAWISAVLVSACLT